MNEIFQIIEQLSKFYYPIFSIGVFSALLSVGGTIITELSKYRAEKKKLKLAQEARFQKVLESNSIVELGSYMDDIIGKFQIREYGENETIRKKVDSYLEKIQNFVGTREDIEQEPAIEKPPQLTTQLMEELPEQFQTVYTELQTGEPWNALAKLRRIIEVRLVNLAGASDIKIVKRYGAGNILKILTDRKLIEQQTVKRLQFAISLSNKAIHGENVSFEDAKMAIRQAGLALKEIDNQWKHNA